MADVLNGLSSTMTKSMSSFVKYMTETAATVTGKLADASGPLKEYVHPSALMFLYLLLLVHFIAWAVENNTKLQHKWPAFAQSMHELRNFIQTWVLGSGNSFDSGLVYWASFAASAGVSARTGSVSEDVGYAMWISMFYVLVWIVNQSCTMLTGEHTNENGLNVIVGMHYASALLTEGKGKPMWIVVHWLQNVTDLVLVNSIKGVTYGYGAGKVVGLLTGQ